MTLQKCLTLVDFQNDFVAPKGIMTFDEGKGDLALISRMNDFFEKLPKNFFDHGIITYDTHEPKTYDNTEEAKNFPLHCAPNTKGWHLAINPKIVLEKVRSIQHLKKDSYDMWKGAPDKLKPEFLDNPQDVYLVGVASDICNRAATDGWLARGAKVTIIEDLTRGIFKETKDVAAEPQYEEAIKNGKLQVITMKQFFNELNFANSNFKIQQGGRL